MSRKMSLIAVAIGGFLLIVTPAGTLAAESAALNVDILRLAVDWEHIKFTVDDKNLQEKQMAALADRAANIVQQYPNQPEAEIWLGIIISEQASMASENGSPFKALSYARQARDILEKVEKIDPVVLDAGAPTSLGVLYYRVPGFPVGFGDKTKARKLLEEAVRNAPNGLDANYFYGDFLYEQHEYTAAQTVLAHALTLPPHPDRPIWDKSRRVVMRQLIVKMTSN